MQRGAIGRIFSQSYRDAGRLIRVLWSAILIESILLLCADWIADQASNLPSSLVGKLLASTLVSIGAIWLAAPYIVAQYRFVILEEVERWPERLRRGDGVRLFWSWSAVIAFATLPLALAARQIGRLEDFLPLLGLVSLVVAYLAVRLITLLPAAALGGPATLSRAWGQSKGHFWFILVAAMLPVASVMVPTIIVAGIFRMFLPSVAGVISYVGTAGAGLLGLSAASRIYEMLAGGPEVDWPGATTP